MVVASAFGVDLVKYRTHNCLGSNLKLPKEFRRVRTAKSLLELIAV